MSRDHYSRDELLGFIERHLERIADALECLTDPCRPGVEIPPKPGPGLCGESCIGVYGKEALCEQPAGHLGWHEEGFQLPPRVPMRWSNTHDAAGAL